MSLRKNVQKGHVFMKPFLGLKINSKLYEGLDKSNPCDKYYFQENNPEFLQIVSVDEHKYIGKFIEQGSELKRIEDICLNITSIIHKLCPDITISTDSIRVLATELSTLTTLK